MDKEELQALRERVEDGERMLVLALGRLDPSLEEFYDEVPMLDGHKNKLKIVRPKEKPAAGYPLIVLFHGGAFSLGSQEMMARPARDFALRFGAVVVSSTYRLAPENKFPIPMQDGIETIAWLGKNSMSKFDANPELAFIVGGVSAGATIAAVACQQAMDTGMSPKPTGAFIVLPFLLVDDIVPEKYREEWKSRDEFPDAPTLNSEAIKDILKKLGPDTKSPLFSPFNSPSPHIGLPRTYIQVGGKDPLRDDGKIFHKVLLENGVEARYDCYSGLAHEAWTILPSPNSPEDLGTRTLDAMAWLLKIEGK
jgi:acetyl esterase/lipase